MFNYIDLTYMNPKWKRAYKPRRRAPARRTRPAKLTQPMRKAIKQVVKGQIETKTINVVDPNSGMLPANTVSKAYGAASGLQYLAQDVFKVLKGVEDSTSLTAQNRIGDKIRASGFLMNYYFHNSNTYTIGGNTYTIPFVKLRIIVFTTAFGVTPPTYALAYNGDFLGANTYTLQPVATHEGYIKSVLMDKTIILRNQNQFATTSSSSPNQQLVHGGVYHFKKYIKYDHPVKYMDENGSSPNNTQNQVHIAISAEIDDSWIGGIPPSGTNILYSTGYTQAWFKDA